jgi:hypothetical protein
LSVSVAAIQPFHCKKVHLDRAKALTVRLLWMLWIAVEKAQKASPPFHNHRESSALYSSIWDSPKELVRSSQ